MDAHRLSIAAIVDQHAEEAAFLALLRDYAVRAPHYDLEELAELDQRIEAHLDGLAIAGQAGHDALLEQLDAHAQGEAFALAVLAMQAGDDALIGRMRACLAASPEARRGFAAALGHDPGPALLSALGHADPAVLARAARTAGELRRRDLMANIRAYRAHDDPSLRFWANWATAQMGDEEALGPLRAFAGQPGPFQLPATMVLLAWQPRDTSMAWIRQLMQAADTRRIGIQATGLFGDPVAVPWLIQQMRDESLARVAGEAFSLITGADLALLDLELEALPDYDPGPNDDPDDEDVALDDDENLSWPEAERVSAWWRDNGARFVAGRAYLLGEPLGEARCRQVLRDGQQRQRMAAACLLARFVPNLPLFPTGAPVRRQLDLF